MFKGFREFIQRGNVVDLAVGVIIGAALGKVVSSLVNDILMPPLGMLLGKVDFSNLFLDLSGKGHGTLAEAKAAGAPTLNYGLFLNALVDFLIVGFAVYVMVQQVNRMRRQTLSNTRECPYCLSAIPLAARRCAHCASDLAAKEP